MSSTPAGERCILKRQLRIGESSYVDALRLRYEVFFKPHGLGPDAVEDGLDQHSRHLALLAEGKLVAYGRMTPEGMNRASFSQMVVSPAHQGTGLGGMLLSWMIGICEQAEIEITVLEARVGKKGFYEKHGFRSVGNIHPSRRTGILHVRMEKQIRGHRK